jgi:membrane-bound lytic murein transglycosylase B
VKRRYLALLAVLVAALARGSSFNLQSDDIAQFVDEVAQRDSFERKELLALLKKARRQPKILEAMSRPAEQVMPWWQYRERFVTSERIERGVRFYLDHRQALMRISEKYGVPAEYLVAILGMETFYGRSTGRYRVLDALATLAFDYPPRAEYFRQELEQFLLLTREDRINPLKATGSYAGAMGAPQFMPSAYRRYAVDEDGDQKRDLWSDWEDILGSVANFFQAHGWERGEPVLSDTEVGPDANLKPPSGKIELTETVDDLAAQGVKLKMTVPSTTPAVLIPAESKDGPAYRVGFKNFYVITRYNRSVRYAMAAHDLAQAIAQMVPGT